jgi:hypothetical protein
MKTLPNIDDKLRKWPVDEADWKVFMSILADLWPIYVGILAAISLWAWAQNRDLEDKVQWHKERSAVAYSKLAHALNGGSFVDQDGHAYLIEVSRVEWRGM